MRAAEDSVDPPLLPEGQLLEDWSLRPWLTGGLLALGGLLIHLLIAGTGEDVPWRVAAAAAVAFGGSAAAFTLGPRRPVEAGGFAVLIALVMGGIAFHTIRMEARLAGEEYAFAAGVFFTLLALPLFQAGFHRTRLATEYRATHFHVWADAVSGGGALAFTGLSWLFLFLLDQLFGLVGIDVIGEVMDEGWFGWVWSGAAFGAGLGVIRNNLKIIGALQNVVMLVFALLAVPFAAALAVFLVALLASGGAALWEATDSATPILLSCAAAAFILFNAIIRDSDAQRSGNRVMQIAAVVLAACVLPLSVFAAISMGIRIDQYGLAPERIWGLIAIAVACAYGLACWAALARGRVAGWSAKLRDANLHLAAGVCVLALVLALPLWDFGATAARNQVARLEAGKVSMEEFDFAALRFDFGDAGREVLAELAAGEGEVAELAADWRDRESRPFAAGPQLRADLSANLRVQPDDAMLRELVLDMLENNPWRCRSFCVALELDGAEDGMRRIALIEGSDYEVMRLPVPDGDELRAAREMVQPAPLVRDSVVEVRELSRRYIVVDGTPLGPSLDLDPGPPLDPLEAPAPER